MAARKKKESLDSWEEEDGPAEEVSEKPVPEEKEEKAAEPAVDIPLIVASMITKPKPKGSIPTFVTFHEGDQVPVRHVILDVPEPFLREAWEFYRDNARNPRAEDFLTMVYDIMKMGIPRLYRKVAKLNLE